MRKRFPEQGLIQEEETNCLTLPLVSSPWFEIQLWKSTYQRMVCELTDLGCPWWSRDWRWSLFSHSLLNLVLWGLLFSLSCYRDIHIQEHHEVLSSRFTLISRDLPLNRGVKEAHCFPCHSSPFFGTLFKYRNGFPLLSSSLLLSSSDWQEECELESFVQISRNVWCGLIMSRVRREYFFFFSFSRTKTNTNRSLFRFSPLHEEHDAVFPLKGNPWNVCHPSCKRPSLCDSKNRSDSFRPLLVLFSFSSRPLHHSLRVM